MDLGGLLFTAYLPTMKAIHIKSENGDLKLTKSTKLVGIKTKQGREPGRVETNVIPDLGGFRVVTLDPNRDVDEALDEARDNQDVEVGTHVYFAEGDNRPVVPTGMIYCQLEEGVAREESDFLVDAFHLELLEEREGGLMILRVTKDSPNPLKVAAALQKLSLVREAIPDFDVPLDQYFTEPRDGLLNHEWHLENRGFVQDVPNFPLKPGADAKVKAAWRRLGNLGSGNLTVAVIDNGFDLDHPDLRGKAVAPLYIKEGHGRLPSGQGFGDHATPCASVAIASANGSGLVGAAPLARLMPLHGLTYSRWLTERMFSHCVRNGADVISCSWGTIDARYKPGTYHEQAIRTALTAGRGGKGCVVVFAAGNEGQDQVNFYGAIPGVICVGASNSNDTHNSYSNRGTGISVVAPSDGGWPILAARASWDPGTQGAAWNTKYYLDGKDRGPYYKHFGGTSSATPLVAGVCALMLSANPELTSAQVKSVLEQTADKIGPGWEYDSRGWSRKYGYGRVNADRAVQEALRLRGGGSVSVPTVPATPPDNTVTPPPRDTTPTRPTIPTTPTYANGPHYADHPRFPDRRSLPHLRDCPAVQRVRHAGDGGQRLQERPGHHQQDRAVARPAGDYAHLRTERPDYFSHHRREFPDGGGGPGDHAETERDRLHPDPEGLLQFIANPLYAPLPPAPAAPAFPFSPFLRPARMGGRTSGYHRLYPGPEECPAARTAYPGRLSGGTARGLHVQYAPEQSGALRHPQFRQERL